jgi:hypothetical protein
VRMGEEVVEFVCMSEAGRVCVSVCVRVIEKVSEIECEVECTERKCVSV